MAQDKRFLLRLDPRLFEVLRRWADDDLRSINGQIEYLLTDQARRTGRLPRPDAAAPAPETTDLDDEAPERRGTPVPARDARTEMDSDQALEPQGVST